MSGIERLFSHAIESPKGLNGVKVLRSTRIVIDFDAHCFYCHDPLRPQNMHNFPGMLCAD